MEHQDNAKETARLEAFSDGVFAIAITLLILVLIETLHSEIDNGLGRLLLENWESFVAFIIGFLTILICWSNHHMVVRHIKKVDSGLTWVNGFVLLVVTFTPFPTAVLAKYFSTDTHLALAIFAFNYFLMSVAAYSITAYPYKKEFIDKSSREIFSCFKQIYGYSIFYTLLIIPVCFFSVSVSIILFFLLFLVFAFPNEIADRLRKVKRQKAK